jgi:toxin FitB
MRYLLDTNVVSETLKRTPEKGVVRWIEQQSGIDLCISVLTLGELTIGMELAPPGLRRDKLQHWISRELPSRFAGRLLRVDAPIAKEWGRLSASGRATGRELPATDGMLLATAAVHRLVFVTRDERDCSNRGVSILNPWM